MNRRLSNRTARVRWHLLGCGLLLPALAAAQSTPPAEPVGDSAVAERSAAEGTAKSTVPASRFGIDLRTESKALREFLVRHMALQRFRTLEDLDASELGRLVDQVPDNLGDLLGTLGHFNPEVEVRLLAAEGASLGTVQIDVRPGPMTQVEAVTVAFRGDIAERPESAEQRAAIQNAFTLRPGDRFTQADWDAAKNAGLRQLTALRYPSGRIDGSLADVDPATHTARLAVEYDSGDPVYVGDVRVEGAERYDTASASHLVAISGLEPGSEYNLANLQEAQRRIAASGYYGSVFVYIEPGVESGPSPVVVQVREQQQQKLVLGVGASTDNGARLSIEHRHHRVPGIGWRANSKLLIERDDQMLSTDWTRPVNAQGWSWIMGAQASRQIDGNDTTTSQRLRAGQSQESQEFDRSFFLQYDRALSVNSVNNALGSGVPESSLSANYAWTRRNFDSLLQPNSGYGLAAEFGVGTTLAPIRRPFFRTRLRWLGYWPIASNLTSEVPAEAVVLGQARPTPKTDNAGRLALRLEAGAVWAKADAPIPETQLFLTGGDNSVRGYGLRNIGIPQADGGVAPGRYLGVASLEWQRPIHRDGVRTPWETVLFVDAGAVADKPNQLRARVGVGAGVRYMSPVGPLQMDLAYGIDAKALRLHLNVGFTF